MSKSEKRFTCCSHRGAPEPTEGDQSAETMPVTVRHTFQPRLMGDIVGQTLPLSLGAATECACAVATTAQFRFCEADQMLQAAAWTAVFTVILFIPFVTRGMLQVTTTLVAKAHAAGDEAEIWRVTRRTLVVGAAASLSVGLALLAAGGALMSVFWRDIPADLMAVPYAIACLAVPLGTVSKTFFVVCRALERVSIPATATVAGSVANLALNVFLIPRYGLMGAVVSFVATQYVAIPLLLTAMLLLGKLPFRVVRGVHEEKDGFRFHMRKSAPEVGAMLAQNAGTLCISLASGMLSAPALLASGVFFDIVDFLCAIGVVSTVTNAFTAKGRTCLWEGVVSIGALSAATTLITVALMPQIAALVTDDAVAAGMLVESGPLLLFYIIASNEADVVGGCLRGKFLNEAAGGWSMASMVVFRCVMPFVLLPLGFIGVVSCYALNRFGLLVGFSAIALRNRELFAYGA